MFGNLAPVIVYVIKVDIENDTLRNVPAGCSGSCTNLDPKAERTLQATLAASF